jgi:predicted RNA-binding protein with RPS1 domain
MNAKQGPAHVVVDGSNLATEGRSMPSLAQLSEAVMSFMEENPDTEITVVVDATFGHRIDKKETKEFEEGISNNELVAPPAGAVGRGDAFVLGIADKAGSTVLSNDSFQEFHGDYEWLFDEGRLVGGKPVPHVGWVWVARTPVRGPISRKATRGSGGSGSSNSGRGRGRGGRGRSRQDEGTEGAARVGSPEASEPMPVPKSPPPAAKKTAAKRTAKKAAVQDSPKSDGRRNDRQSEKRAPRGGDPVNELLPFLEFVEHHPVGTGVTGIVDSYSSHGAYITMGDETRGYIPLRMMVEPTPRSAKSIMKIGESVEVVVVSFNGARRSIDCALPDMAEAAIAEAEQDADAGIDEVAELTAEQPTKKTAAKKKTATKKTAAKKTAAKKTAPKKTASKKPASKKPAEPQPAAAKPSVGTVERIPAKKTPVKQAAPKQSAAPKQAAATKTAVKKTAVQKTATKKTAVKKAPVKKAAVKKTAVKKAAVKKAPVKKIAVKKAPVKKTAVKKAPVKKAAVKKAPVKKTGAKKTPAKKTAAVKGP